VSLSLSLSQSLNPNWNLKHVHVAAAVVAAAAVPQVTKINILPGIIPTFGFLSISLLCGVMSNSFRVSTQILAS
jgi:hypothetical protein